MKGRKFMLRGRNLRQPGETLILGETEYCVEGVQGQGGSAVVYRARYEDSLNRGCYHHVLIKELFPYHPKGWVYRDEQGWIRCCPEGENLMEQCRNRFFQGNAVNLKLLEALPEKISGNLNSCEAYGTCYSVLYVHGGQDLEHFLEGEKENWSLLRAAEVMEQILDALEPFHENGLLHLDISPDNILMLPGRAMLIDYNSVWPENPGEQEEFLFSEKEGYTAPEVRLKEIREIGPAADLYGVCAVFFTMLTGRRLTPEESMGKGLERAFPKDLDIFRGQPETAAWQTVRIIKKGLHLLPRKRYGSVKELREDVRELLLRIDGWGISHSALWEGSLREWKKSRGRNGGDLKRRLMLRGGQRGPARKIPEKEQELSEEDFIPLLEGGGCFLLYGPGGMGKTSFLQMILRRGLSCYSPAKPVVLCISLADYPEVSEEPFYIRRQILKKLMFLESGHGMEEAMTRLDQLLSGEERIPTVLLLDGLNEAGARRQNLLKEIEGLGRSSSLGILVTDRTDSVKAYGLADFHPVRLMELTGRQVEEELLWRQFPQPDGKLRRLLGNPMMLWLYGQTAAMDRELGRANEETVPITMDSLVGSYLEGLCAGQLRLYSGDQAEQLRQSYLIRHLLPEIAGEMKRRKRPLLTLEELYPVVRQGYETLRSKAFSLSFPEYLGKSRLMLQGIASESEWFDYAVSEQLTEALDLLRVSGNGNYGLLHENFAEYLAAQAGENRRRLGRYKRRAGQKRVLAGAALLILLMGGGAAAWHTWGPKTYSAKEKQVFRNVAQRLMMNLQILDLQLMSQHLILEDAGSGRVLEGDAFACQSLKESIERKLQELESERSMANDGSHLVEALEELGTEMPLDVLQELYGKSEEMAVIMEEAMAFLEDSLCSADSPYTDRNKREPLVKAYENYLEAYSRECYVQLNRVLFFMEPEAAQMVQEAIAQMSILKQYILDYPLSEVTEEELENQQKAAANQRKDARDALRRQHFPVDDGVW